MKSALLRIITNQSVFPSLTEISVLGHTNITGTNGAGKTSSLVLIPVFYGIDPNYMVKEKSKNFQDFYLSKARSFVIFEYQRQEQLICVVVYQHNNALHYRFVMGDANSTLFTEQNKAKLNSAENIDRWLAEHVAQTTEVSRQIKTIKDYCAIIQHNLSHLSPIKARQSGLKDLADKYSFCRPGQSMRHIERLTSVMLKKTKLMEGLKNMIADCFIDSQLDVGKAPYNANDTLTIDALSALKGMMSSQREFEAAIQAYDDIKVVWSTLLRLNDELDSHRATITSEQTKTQSQLGELRAQLTNDKRQFDASISGKQATVIELQSTCDHLTKALDKLYQERDEYDALDLDDKAAAYNELNSLVSCAQEAKDHHKVLLESVEAEDSAYQAQRSNVIAKESQRREEIEGKISTIEREKTNHLVHVNEQAQEIERETNEAIKQYEVTRNGKRNELVLAINQAARDEEKANHETQEEKGALDKIQKQRDAIDEEASRLDDHEGQTQYQLDDTESTITDHKNHLRGLKQKLSECEETIESVQSLLHPNKNSLRAYLSENVPDWRQTFGRLLSVEALNNTQLNPTIVESNDPGSIFGLKLKTEQAELPDYAQPNEQLEQRVKLLLRDKDALLTQVGACEQDILTTTAQIHKLNTELSRIKNKQQSLRRNGQQLRLERERLEMDFKNAMKVRLDKASQVLTAAEQNLETFDTETNETTEIISSNGNKRKQEYCIRESIRTAEFEAAIKLLDTQIDESKKLEKEQLTELKTVYDGMLRSKNIDDKAVTKAKKRADELAAQVENVRGYRKILEEFNLWKETRWATVEEKEHNQYKNQAKLREEEALLRALKSECYIQLEKLSNECEKMEGNLNTYKANLADIEGRQRDLEEQIKQTPFDHPPEVRGEETPLALLLTQSTDVCNNSRKLTTKIKQAIHTANEILSEGNARNAISEAWVQYKLEYDKLRMPGSERDRVFDRAEALERLVRESIPNITKLQLENMKMLGQRYVRFYESLKALNLKVKSVSSMLGERMNTSNKFPGITDIRVLLKSKFEEFEIWHILQQLTRVWNEWAQAGQTELPDDTLLQAASSTVEAMKNGGMRRFQNDTVSHYIEMHLCFSENGNAPVIIKNDEQLVHSSSTGLTELALLAVFGGMTRFLCNDNDVQIHWPMDEMGRLHDENITRIFNFMDNEKITLFCAEPKLNQVHRQRFTNKYRAVRGKGIERFQYAEGQSRNRILDEELTHA